VYGFPYGQGLGCLDQRIFWTSAHFHKGSFFQGSVFTRPRDVMLRRSSPFPSASTKGRFLPNFFVRLFLRPVPFFIVHSFSVPNAPNPSRPRPCCVNGCRPIQFAPLLPPLEFPFPSGTWTRKIARVIESRLSRAPRVPLSGSDFANALPSFSPYLIRPLGYDSSGHSLVSCFPTNHEHVFFARAISGKSLFFSSNYPRPAEGDYVT